ncbi:uncharacterized protein C22orf15-like [Branchiostoma floridae x Branchiostoma belcheri]|nr:hypothetical protein Bbelb_085290 [Branchiostoma belcheri]
MYIVAKYGDGESTLFNPDCMVVNLVRHMQEKCGYPNESGLDLVDQNGETRGLSRYPRRANAARLFNDRNVYILVNIERGPDGSYRDVIPLIEGGADSVPELYKKMTLHLQQLEHQRLEELKKENERREKEKERQRALEEERHHKKKVSLASPDTLAPEKSTHKKTPEKSRPSSRASLDKKDASKVNISRGRGRKH